MTDKKAEAVKAKTEGNKQFKAKNYDKAIESYTKAVELDPEKVIIVLHCSLEKEFSLSRKGNRLLVSG